MGKRILLIEADDSFATSLDAAFGQREAEVVHTADGKEGLRLAETSAFDAIVLCVELPRMSGYAVCNKLKKSDALRDVPLIITSSEATPRTFEQHRKLKTRAEDYVIKPCPPDEVVARVDALVGLAGDASGPVPAEDEFELLDDAFEALEMDDASGPADEDAGLGGLSLDALDLGEAEVEEVDTAELAIDALGRDEADAGFEAVGPLGGEAPAADPEIDEDLFGGELDVLAFDDEAGAEAPAPSESPPRPHMDGRLAALEAENERLRRERAELEARLSGLQDDLRARTHELETHRQAGSTGGATARELVRLKSEITRRDKEILSLKEALNAREGDALAQQERENALELKAAEQEEAALANEARVRTLQEKVDDQDRRIGRLQVDLDEARAQLRRSAELEFEVEALSEERERLQQEASSAGARVAEAEGHASALEAESATLRERAAELEARVRELEDESRRHEDRMVKAYKRLKSDERAREKTRKALLVALELLDGTPEAPEEAIEDLGVLADEPSETDEIEELDFDSLKLETA